MTNDSKDIARRPTGTARKAYVRLDNRGKQTYIDTLRRTGMRAISAQAAGVSVATIIKHLKKDEQFAESCNESLESYRDTIEAEAYRRAVTGFEKGIYYQGVRMDTELQYSDALMQTLLKGNRPEKYRDRLDVDARVIAGVMVIATADAPEPEQSDSWAKDNREVIDVDSED